MFVNNILHKYLSCVTIFAQFSSITSIFNHDDFYKVSDNFLYFIVTVYSCILSVQLWTSIYALHYNNTIIKLTYTILAGTPAFISTFGCRLWLWLWLVFCQCNCEPLYIQYICIIIYTIPTGTLAFISTFGCCYTTEDGCLEENKSCPHISNSGQRQSRDCVYTLNQISP